MLQTLKFKKIIFFLVFALAIFLIVFRFTDTPKVWVDEGVFTETAKNLAWHGTLGLQTEPGKFFSMRNFLLSTSYPVIFPVATSFSLFGTGIWQARLPMLIYMFGLVIVFYLFVKKRHGFYPAILSVLLLISFSPFYGNGRPVQGEVPGLFFLSLGALLLLFWEESNFKSWKWALLSGLSLGLSASTKPIFLILIPMAAFVVFVFWFKKIEAKKMLLVLGSGFILPVLFWVYIHFPTIKEIMEFISNIMYFSSNHGSESSLFQTILTNFSKFFTESTPILFFIIFLTIIFSLAHRFYIKRELNLKISEIFILLFIIFNWLGFLLGTGWYRYFFPAHILLYLMFPTAVLILSKDIKKGSLNKLFLIISIMLVVFQFFHLIFLSDTSFAAKRTRNVELTAVLAEIDPSKKVFFNGSIEALVFFKGNNYSQYLNMGFLKAGKENFLGNSNYDVILTDASQKDNRFLLSCYDKKSVSRYFLFQKKNSCK